MPTSETLLRSCAAIWTQFQLRGCAEVGPGSLVEGRVWLHGPGQVFVGAGVRFGAHSRPVELHAGPGAAIRIGDGSEIAGGVSIEAEQLVSIGRGCRLGANCKVIDNNFHQNQGDRHLRPPSQPVILEDGAVLGARAILLPGAHVGRGLHVPAGAVVSGRFAGSP